MNLEDAKLKYVITKNNNMTRRLKNAYVVIQELLFLDKLDKQIRIEDETGREVVCKEDSGGIVLEFNRCAYYISPVNQSLYVHVQSDEKEVTLNIKANAMTLVIRLIPEDKCLIPLFSIVDTYYLGRFDIVGPCPEHVSDILTDYALLERIADEPKGLVFKAVNLGLQNMIFARLSGYHVILRRDNSMTNNPLRFISDAGRQPGDCSVKNGGFVYRGCRVVLMSNGTIVVASRSYMPMVLIPDEEFSTREALEWYVAFVDNYASDAGAAELMNRIRSEVSNRAPGSVGLRKAIANVMTSSEARGMGIDEQFSLVRKYFPNVTDEAIKDVAIEDLHWSPLVFRKEEAPKKIVDGVTYLQDVSITGVAFSDNTLTVDVTGTVVGQEPKTIPVTFTCKSIDSDGQSDSV